MEEQEPETKDKALSKVEARAADRRARADEKFRRKQLKRGDHLADLESKAEVGERKAAARAARWTRIKGTSATALRSFMIGGPILAPMSVAWTGQASFAMDTLGWAFLGGVLYAAAYELTAVFCAWMYHEARKDGDKGWEYRVATWLFAMGAAVQQWWHYADDWHATPRSVTYSTMTMVGLLIWELYARLMHRRKLRADGRIGGVRPRLGLARWVRYPRISWTAWSMSILHNLTTLEEAWTRAEKQEIRRKKDKELKRSAPTSPDPAPITKSTEQTQPDPKPISSDLKVERADLPGPRTDLKELTAGSEAPSADPEQASEQTSGDLTDLELQAVREMIDKKIRLNRTNVADYVRNELGGGIATKRAAEVAAWGRNNGEGQMKAV